MDSLVGIGITSFLVALSGALMPGPLLTTTVVESVRCGARAGPLLVAGHAILELVPVAALFLGIAPLLTNNKITAGISIAGGVILLWLSIGMLRSLSKQSLEPDGLKNINRGRLITAGILVSLSNPYWTLWWATLGMVYVLQSRQFGIAGVAVFFAGHTLADLSWYSLVSFTVGNGKRYFTNAIYRWLIGVCAVFLMGFAVWFFQSGVKMFSI